MTEVTISTGEKDVVIETPQPVVPPSAPPVQVGLVEISQVVQRGSIWYTGSGPPTTSGGQVGDLYLDMDTGDVYRWDGNSWVFQGTFAPSTDTPAEVLAKLITVDGSGSLLDADTLDGHDSLYFSTQTDMSAVQAKNTAQDTSINQNITDIANLQIANSTQDTTISGKADKTYVDSQDALKANIASPTFTGDPKAPTASPGDSDTSIATTAFVSSAVSTAVAAGAVPPATVPPLMDGTAAVGVATKYAREDHKHPSDTAKIGDAPNDGVQYVRQSLAWSPVNVPPGTVVSDTAPASPQSGQMWLKSSTMVLYCWYVDPNTAQWVMVSASPQTVDQNYSRKTALRNNHIINGSMAVSQENGDSGSSPLGASGSFYPADQWLTQVNTSGAIVTFRFASPTPNGSKYRARVTVNTVDTSLTAGEYVHILQIIEGNNIADFLWGTANARQVVLRFGFSGPAGTYAISLRNSAFSRTYLAPFTIAAGQANTDTTQTFVISGDTTGTWLTDNGIGVRLGITFAASSDQLGVAGWQASSFLGISGITNNIGAANTFDIFDVGLYADPDKTGLAPTFEVTDYATELAKCMRYFSTSYVIFSGSATTGGVYYVSGSLPVSMRSGTPTLSGVNSAVTGFPAVVGALTMITGSAYRENRTSNSTNAAAYFASNITANSRM